MQNVAHDVAIELLLIDVDLEPRNIEGLVLAKNRNGCLGGHITSRGQRGYFQDRSSLKFQRIENGVLVGDGTPLSRVVIDLI